MAVQVHYTYNLTYTNDRLESDEAFAIAINHKQSDIIVPIDVPTAYLMVENIRATKENVEFLLHIFKDATKQVLLDCIKINFEPDLSSENTPNFYTQAYNHVKAIDIFATAIDV